MRVRRVGILVLLYLLGGLASSYVVAWYTSYLIAVPYPQADMSEVQRVPSSWPMAMPGDWPSIETALSQPGPGRLRVSVLSTAASESSRYSTIVDKTAYVVIEERVGWPALSASGLDRQSATIGARMTFSRGEFRPWYAGLQLMKKSWTMPSGDVVRFPIYFPVRPIWAGLVTNTVFYALVLFAILWLRGRMNYWLRRQFGLCVKCKHPLGTLLVCEKCGTPVGDEARVPTGRGA
ncbi:MAG: hypothetical protein AABZ53_01690 [Planctomycetota bacterium]